MNRLANPVRHLLSNGAKILLITESIWTFGSGLFLPIFAIFSAQIGGDILDAGIAAALFLIATSALEWPIGHFLDRFKEKWFIVADYFLEGLIFIGYIFVDNKWELFALQILLGIANAIGDPAWESLYDKHTANKNSGKAWAASHMYVGYFTAIAILIGSTLVNFYGFKLVFLIGAVFSFAAGLMAMVLIKKGVKKY